MTSYDNYFTYLDKVYAENLNDALLLSNVFDMTVPVSIPTMFSDQSWINTTKPRKCSVAIVTLKESLSENLEIAIVEGQSVLRGSGTIKLGFYPNFNTFGRFKSINWINTGDVSVTLKTISNNIIAENISKGDIEIDSSSLTELEEIIIEIQMSNAVLKSLDIVMENKRGTRYGAEVGIKDVDGLTTRLQTIEDVTTNIFDLVYPIGSIYMSTNQASPETLFGGTWQQLEGRFLLGAGTTSNTEKTYTNGAMAGSKDAIVVEHTHTQKSHSHTQASHTHSLGNHTHKPSDTSLKFLATKADVKITDTKRKKNDSGTNMYDVYASNYNNGIGQLAATSPAASSIDSRTPTISATQGVNNSTGESGIDKNMPPYLVVYMWKRTA